MGGFHLLGNKTDQSSELKVMPAGAMWRYTWGPSKGRVPQLSVLHCGDCYGVPGFREGMLDRATCRGWMGSQAMLCRQSGVVWSLGNSILILQSLNPELRIHTPWPWGHGVTEP